MPLFNLQPGGQVHIYYYYEMLGTANALHEGRNLELETVREKALQ
jgi:hypothetical protein